MDLKDLRCLIAIADRGSFVAAAEAEGMSQPSLSNRIRALEDHFGVALFRRSNKGAEVTEDGTELLRHARAILRQFEEAEAEMQFFRSNPVGLVRLGLPTSLTSTLAIPILERCLETLPNVKVRIVESMTGYISRWLLDGTLDLGITFGTNAPPGIDILPLAQEDLLVVGADTERLASLLDENGDVPLRRLDALDLVLPGPEHGLRTLIESLARQNGVRINAVIEIDVFSEIMQLVAKGYGWTIVSSAAFRKGAFPQLSGARVARPYISRIVNTAVASASPPSRARRDVSKVIRLVIEEQTRASDWLARSIVSKP